MRIVAGAAKGRKLLVPKGREVRPTLDRVREALFSSLGNRVLEARVLDLFAGSGALGLEALSRGADHAVFVEKSREVRRVLRANIETLGFQESSRTMSIDGMKALRRFDEEQSAFDLIFLDPPYATNLLERSICAIADSNRLAEGGVIVAEHGSQTEITVPKSLHLRRTKSYGDVSIALIGKESAAASFT